MKHRILLPHALHGNRLAVLLTCAAIAIFSVESMAQPSSEDVQKQYLNARQLSMHQEWEAAIAAYRKVIAANPQGTMADDAQFWLAFSLEKLPGKQTEAFDAYEKIHQTYPGSAWVDDALSQQIGLAEDFSRDGQEKYHRFLTRQLDSRYDNVRHLAALALGRLGDESALPLLQELQAHKEFGELSDALVSQFNQASQPKPVQPLLRSGKKRGLAIQSYNDAEKLPALSESGISFESRRYEQYSAMLKSGKGWPMPDLIDFGLWHILPPDQFTEYFSLRARSDREAWLETFWKRRDPTPTTVKNEAQNEFARRVRYAHANLFEFWNYQETKYLKDQHIRKGQRHAPWDARGELYIKYGEPDQRNILAWHTENWVYFRHNLDLMVKQYMTNIYGNAINGTTINSRQAGRRFTRGIDRDRVNAEFIYNPVFEYTYESGQKPIKGIEFEEKLSNGVAEIIYRIPLDEVQTGDGDEDAIAFTREWILFDASMTEVKRERDLLKKGDVTVADKRAIERLRIPLRTGKYRLVLELTSEFNNTSSLFQFDINQE